MGKYEEQRDFLMRLAANSNSKLTKKALNKYLDRDSVNCDFSLLLTVKAKKPFEYIKN